MSLMSSFWDTISSTAESVVESVKETASDVADAVEEGAEAAYDAAGDAAEAVAEGAEAAYDAAGDAAEAAYEAVEEGAEAAYDAAGDAAEAVAEGAEAAYDAAGDAAEAVAEGAEAAYDAAGDAAEAIGDAAETVYDAAGDAAEAAYEAVEEGAEAAYDAAGDAAEAVAEGAEAAYDAAGDAAESAYEAVEEGAEAAYDAAGDAVEAIGDAAETVYDAASDAAEAVEEEAAEIYDDVSEAFKDVAEGVDDVLDSVFGESEEEQKTRTKNVEAGAKQFGSGSGKFKDLKGAENLNPRQKQIFDEKLKQALERDPRAKRGELSEAELKELAQQAAEVSDKLSKTTLGDPVNNLAAKSAKLKDNLVKLQNAGWVIKAGAPGSTSFADRDAVPPVIMIDPSLSTKDLVETLAHETGHADFTKPADPSIEDPSPDVAKAREYIRKSVENSLLDEGQAQIIACQAAKELEDAGETGINIPGGNSAKYKAVYAKIEAGTLSMEDGRREMAKIMATEVVSGPGARNYIDYYSDAPRANWNAKHPTAQVPATTPRVGVFP